jgi:hypothetical protein
MDVNVRLNLKKVEGSLLPGLTAAALTMFTA